MSTNSSQESYSDIISRDRLYSDLDIRFEPNPITGDVNRLSDVISVKRAIVNLLLTQYGERPFMNTFGSGIARQLFENHPIDVLSLKNNIIRTIQRNEPRVSKVNNVMVSTTDDNVFLVRIDFQVSNASQDIQSINVTLKRNR